ncbi:MAG: AAA family ATPase [Sphingobium sp.]|nr:AAA family ATPase [Sphingobium sp.]
MSAAQNITRHFNGTWHGSYGTIPTPGHSGKDRGTTVKDGEDGEVLFHSFNGNGDEFRDLKDECRRAGLLPDWKPASTQLGNWRETGAYAYRDASGATLYRTVRLEKPGEGKRFKAQRLDGAQWVNGMGDVERIPYRLPELAEADPAKPVFFVEGERKADKLTGWGMVATAIAFGAKGWRSEYAQFFAGRHVVILPDNDEPGQQFADKVSSALSGIAANVAVLNLPDLPPKGDIMDWKGTAAELTALVARAEKENSSALPLADLSAWAVTSPAPKTFIMAGFVPEHELTLATGAGGANKSTFGQQLATCVASGKPMLGIDVAYGSALYVTCEDDENRLHWMQEHICKALGVRIADLAGRLHLSTLRGRLGNELATFDNDGRLHVSPAFGLLKETIAKTRPRLVVLDNAAHFFIGNENDRGQVTAFVNMLYGLCLEHGCTLILVAHANKAGDSYSGSTAWLNAVRSQIVLTRSNDADPDERLLSLGKANYARQGEELKFRWNEFALCLDTDLSDDRRAELASAARAASDNGIFLACLAKRIEQRRAVSEKRGPTYAPTEFAKMAESKTIGKARLEQAMERLFTTGQIERARLWKGDDRKDVFGLRETAGNGAGNGAATLCANAGNGAASPQNSARATQVTHTLPLKGEEGAAPGSLAPSPSRMGQPVF